MKLYNGADGDAKDQPGLPLFLLGTINQVPEIFAQTDHPILVDSNGSSV